MVVTNMDFKSFREQRLKDPALREAYEESQPAYAITHAMVEARIRADLTQKELSERSGIAQSDISKYENGNGNPSLRTLQRLAKAMGKRVHITFDDLEPAMSAQSEHISEYRSEEFSGVTSSFGHSRSAKVISIASNPDYHYFTESSYTELKEE
nr:MAG TPA: helix-turn-helix domain protein [Caudoviricetes sp.]